MKTKSTYLVAVLLVSAFVAFGNDEPKKAGLAVLHGKGSEVFKVIYKNETAGKVKVNVYNDRAEVVYTEQLTNTAGFILPLNFSKLGFGAYTVELIDASGKQIEKIVYEPTKVENIRIAKLGNADGKFLVSVMNAKNDKVTVRIFDNYNNLLHDEVKSVSGDFAQVYTVKNLTGACTFEVTDNSGHVKTVQF